MFLFISLFLLISFLLDWYCFQGLKVITCGLRSGKKVVYIVYWLLLSGTSILLVISFLLMNRDAHGIPPFTQWLINVFLTLFVTKLAFTIVLLMEDFYRFFATVVKTVKGDGKKEDLMPERRKFISQIGVIIAGIPFLSFIYGITRGKYDYTVHREILYFDDLPEAFDGFTITQLSDIHSGSFDNVEAVQRGIDLANAQKSDLFVFTGDLINNVAEEIMPWVSHFKQIKAPFGQFSIMGNHDYGDYVEWNSPEEKTANIEKLKEYHALMDYKLLLDESVKIEKDGQKIELLGVENWGNGFIQKGDLDRALQGTEKASFKILLSHDPSHWEERVKTHAQKIHLTLSGHTHGMQLGIEIPTIKWSPVQYRYPHWAGLKIENNKSLYINRGFGFIGFSGRVGIWPEITVLELRKS